MESGKKVIVRAALAVLFGLIAQVSMGCSGRPEPPSGAAKPPQIPAANLRGPTSKPDPDVDSHEASGAEAQKPVREADSQHDAKLLDDKADEKVACNEDGDLKEGDQVVVVVGDLQYEVGKLVGKESADKSWDVKFGDGKTISLKSQTDFKKLDKCAICYDEMTNPVAAFKCTEKEGTNVPHFYCKECVENHKKKNKKATCPECRQPNKDTQAEVDPAHVQVDPVAQVAQEPNWCYKKCGKKGIVAGSAVGCTALIPGIAYMKGGDAVCNLGHPCISALPGDVAGITAGVGCAVGTVGGYCLAKDCEDNGKWC